MKFKGFEKEDFELFLIDGLEERMEVLIKQLRPKFYDLGVDLRNELSIVSGEEMFPHVAKHARRKTNPPNDSWVAFASNQRGYKMLPHFQIAVWHTHVLIQWGLIYESKNKTAFGNALAGNITKVREKIPNDYHFFKDHMKPEGESLSNLSDEQLLNYANRLMNNKNGELMIGEVLSKEKALSMKPHEFYELVMETWKNLIFLHNLSKNES